MSLSPMDVPDMAPPGPGLSPWMRAEVRALAEALFSTHDGPPPAERLDWLVDDLHDFLSHAGSRARGSFQLCLTAVASLAPVAIGRRPTLASLPLPERLRSLERLEHSPAALAIFGAKAILCMLYYEHADAPRENGFVTDCLKGGHS